MTNSEIIEEILHKAHKLGIEKSIFERAKQLQSAGKDLMMAYELAWMEICPDESYDVA
jgi:hypothetical protein